MSNVECTGISLLNAKCSLCMWFYVGIAFLYALILCVLNVFRLDDSCFFFHIRFNAISMCNHVEAKECAAAACGVSHQWKKNKNITKLMNHRQTGKRTHTIECTERRWCATKNINSSWKKKTILADVMKHKNHTGAHLKWRRRRRRRRQRCLQQWPVQDELNTIRCDSEEEIIFIFHSQ